MAKNYYEMLGVAATASGGEISAAFRALALELHPDHHNNDPDKAARLAELTVAYNALKNTKSRANYDSMIKLCNRPCPACKGNGATYKQKGFIGRVAHKCTACNGTGILKGEQRGRT